MIDPKMLELSDYEGIPHLLLPVVTNPKKAAVALKWLVEEMERRYTVLAEKGVRNIEHYHQRMEKELKEKGKVYKRKGDVLEGDEEKAAEPMERIPYIVVVIDELADLMMISSREVEESITRLAQMARAVGIHLLLATQRPSVDVLTGIIKANFPARISFQVTSKVDSRTILDTIGAEHLLGAGDMLFLPPGSSKLTRLHGAFVSSAEIKRIVEFLKKQGKPSYRSFDSCRGEERKRRRQEEKMRNTTRNMMRPWPLWPRPDRPRSPSSKDDFGSVIIERPASSKRWRRKEWWDLPMGSSPERFWLRKLNKRIIPMEMNWGIGN